MPRDSHRFDRSGLLTDDRRRRRRLVLRSVLCVVLIGALFVGVLPQLADLSSVWAHIGTMSVMQLSWLCAVAIGSLLAYGLVLMAVMPGLTFAQATVVSQSSTAVANTMPAGGALAVGVSYRFYGSWGFSRAAITRNVVVTGIWNIFSKLALPVVAMVLLVSTGGGGNGVIAAAVVGLVVLLLAVVLGALTLSSEHAAHRVGDVVGAGVVRVARGSTACTRRPVATSPCGSAATRSACSAIAVSSSPARSCCRRSPSSWCCSSACAPSASPPAR